MCNDENRNCRQGNLECVKGQLLQAQNQAQEPIVCDSSKIEYVTGFNAKYIIENKIHKNAKLKIGLSGNVIPHIFDIIETPYDGPQEVVSK